VVVTARGAIVRSDLGTLELAGADVGAFVSGMLPLLDGSRTLEELSEALPGYQPDTVATLLRTLIDRGAVEPVEAEAPPWHRQARWLSRFADADAALRRLEAARVLLVGLEPWGATAAVELARAGVGRLEALDDDPVTEDDLLATAAFFADDIGRRRREALARRGGDAPGGGHGRAAEALGGGGPLDALMQRLDEPWDLVIVALPGDALRELDAVARATHARRVRSLHAYLEGTDAVLGPAVEPGASACWNCTRLRRLGHAPDPRAAHELQLAALAEGMPRRERAYLAPAAGLLGHLLALEALKLLTGYGPSPLVGRQLVQSLVTLETTRHSIVRLPWCDVCGGPGPAGDPPGGVVLDDLETPGEVREALAGWVDDRTGVIGPLRLDAPDADLPELPVTATAVIAPFADGRRPPADAETASGKGLTAARALVGAAGEAIERYSAARFRVEELRRTPRPELDGDVLDPRDLCLYDAAQYDREGFPFDRYDPDGPLHWTTGRWLDDGAPVWAPALPSLYQFHAPPGERLCQVTSNGLAAGVDAQDAALRATLELVERDAFMLTWLARLPGRRVLAEGSLESELQEALRQLEQCGARIELWLLDAGIPLPTIACLGHGDGERWPGLTLSLSCHPSPRTAAGKAILEHGHVGPHIARTARTGQRPVPREADEVRDLFDHALYYVPPERGAAADFLAAGADPIALGDLPEPDGAPLKACRAALAQAGVRVAIVDVTAPDVATGPFRVARALGVDVQPIHFGHGLERLANPRLWERLAGPPNPEPHPLA
jgi:ribosomal protein S12 methylthiotransferase accessory factor